MIWSQNSSSSAMNHIVMRTNFILVVNLTVHNLMYSRLAPLDGSKALQMKNPRGGGKKGVSYRWPIANVFICFQSKHTFLSCYYIIIIIIIIFTHIGFSLGALFVPLPTRRASARD